MERIGMAASKMAKGNLFLYNFYVILICILFSLFIFIVAAMTVALALILIAAVVNEMNGQGLASLDFNFAFIVCLAALTIVIALFNLFAILKNLKLRKSKSDPIKSSPHETQ